MRYLLIAVMAILMLTSATCQKDGGECGEPSTVTVTSNSPVVEGWPLVLTTSDDISLMYHWKGPNGYDVRYDIHTTDAADQEKVAALTDNGTFTVEMRDDDGCVMSKGSTVVVVTAPPNAPCTVPNNTSTSSVVGVGGSTYNNVYFNGGSPYTVQASGGGESMNFRFQGNNGAAPRAGLYRTSGYGTSENDQVGLWITVSPHDFIAQAGQTVYVTKVNNKTVISFCNLTFTNPVGPTLPRISAKITQT